MNTYRINTIYLSLFFNEKDMSRTKEASPCWYFFLLFAADMWICEAIILCSYAPELSGVV